MVDVFGYILWITVHIIIGFTLTQSSSGSLASMLSHVVSNFSLLAASFSLSVKGAYGRNYKI